MRKAKDIFEDAKEECSKDNCQSINSMSLVAIEKAQKEMFDFIYDKAVKYDSSLVLMFMDELDKELNF